MHAYTRGYWFWFVIEFSLNVKLFQPVVHQQEQRNEIQIAQLNPVHHQVEQQAAPIPFPVYGPPAARTQTVTTKTVQQPITSYGTPVPSYDTAAGQSTVEHHEVFTKAKSQVVAAAPAPAPIKQEFKTIHKAPVHHEVKTVQQQSAAPAIQTFKSAQAAPGN